MNAVISDETVLANLAHHVRFLRVGRRWSLSELARQSGTCPIHIRRIEHQERMPGFGLVARIADALGVTSDSLLAAPRADFLPAGDVLVVSPAHAVRAPSRNSRRRRAGTES